MIICVCHNVSELKIRNAVADGVRKMADLRAELKVGTCCGKCHSCAKAVLREALEDEMENQQQAVLPAALAA